MPRLWSPLQGLWKVETKQNQVKQVSPFFEGQITKNFQRMKMGNFWNAWAGGAGGRCDSWEDSPPIALRERRLLCSFQLCSCAILCNLRYFFWREKQCNRMSTECTRNFWAFELSGTLPKAPTATIGVEFATRWDHRKMIDRKILGFSTFFKNFDSLWQLNSSIPFPSSLSSFKRRL